MRRALTPHPDWLGSAVNSIDVEVARPHACGLTLAYFVSGRIGDLRLPPMTTPARADELWRHTCFEAFILAPPGPAYCEFNFAPCTRWAAYRFSDYRSGMQVADVGAPRIEVQVEPERLTLRAALDLEPLSDLPHEAAWRMGLSAVTEDANGRMSYWALAHPPGKADFHHSDCFAFESRPPYRP
jgi:hypothetical protein